MKSNVITRLVIPEEIIRHKHFNEWKIFHLNNRHIIRLICQELNRQLANGKKKTSVKTIIGKIRYHNNVSTASKDLYSINDKYTSIYAHILMATFPKYSNFIEIRKIRSIKK